MTDITTHDLEIDQRVEVYTPATGTYWGYVADLHHIDGLVDLIEVAPEGDKPSRIEVENIVKVLAHVLRGCTCPPWRKEAGQHVLPCPHAKADR